MFKKRYIIAAVLLAVVIASACFFWRHKDSIAQHLVDAVLEAISVQLDKEERERLGAKYPDFGKDTVRILGDGTFQVIKVSKEQHLVLCGESDLIDTVLRKITDVKLRYGTYFVASEEGYAAIDRDTNQCRVFLTTGRVIEEEAIIYLQSFEDFTLEEQSVLNELEH